MKNTFADSTFVQFLHTGELGPLKFSLSLEAVYQLLGKPHEAGRPYEDSGRDDLDLLNLLYDNLSISFYRGNFTLFVIRFDEAQKGDIYKGRFPNRLNTGWYQKVRKMNLKAFLELLKSQALPCRRLNLEGTGVLRIEQSGLEVVFDPEDDYKIYKIICSVEKEPGNREFIDC